MARLVRLADTRGGPLRRAVRNSGRAELARRIRAGAGRPAGPQRLLDLAELYP